MEQAYSGVIRREPAEKVICKWRDCPRGWGNNPLQGGEELLSSHWASFGFKISTKEKRPYSGLLWCGFCCLGCHPGALAEKTQGSFTSAAGLPDPSPILFSHRFYRSALSDFLYKFTCHLLGEIQLTRLIKSRLRKAGRIEFLNRTLVSNLVFEQQIAIKIHAVGIGSAVFFNSDAVHPSSQWREKRLKKGRQLCEIVFSLF